MVALSASAFLVRFLDGVQRELPGENARRIGRQLALLPFWFNYPKQGSIPEIVGQLPKEGFDFWSVHG